MGKSVRNSHHSAGGFTFDDRNLGVPMEMPCCGQGDSSRVDRRGVFLDLGRLGFVTPTTAVTGCCALLWRAVESQCRCLECHGCAMFLGMDTPNGLGDVRSLVSHHFWCRKICASQHGGPGYIKPCRESKELIRLIGLGLFQGW